MGLFNNEGGIKGPMSRSEAKKYVKRNGVLVPSPEWTAENIECIDDRRKSDGIGYPGGVLGMAATLFSSVDTDSRKKIGGFSGIGRSLEQFFGGMSGHTDDHNEDHAFPCAGCGHLQAIRNSPDEYEFGSEHLPDFDDYVGSVSGRARDNKRGFNIFNYLGGHNARAVMHINSVDDDHHITLPPNDETDQVFVNHRGVNRVILDNARGVLQGIFGGIFVRDPKEMYDKQLGLTAKRLGADKIPHYTVSSKDGKITID